MFYSQWLGSIGKPYSNFMGIAIAEREMLVKDTKSISMLFLRKYYYIVLCTSYDVTIFIIIIVIVILAAYEQQIYSPGCMICNVQFGCLCIVGTRERRQYRRRRSEIQKFRRRMATLGENMARKRFWIQSIRGTKLVRARKLVHALWILNND